jgi:CubicO group peptidase (beta-lactamase class C family)
MMWFNSSATRAELCRRLRHLEPSRDFRSLFQYNNLMYMVAGQLIEEVSGLPWEQFVRERIFRPLGMTASGFFTDVEPPPGIAAAGHVKKGKRVLRYDRSQPREARMSFASDPVGPAGSIVSTVSDLCRWICLQMNGGRVGRRAIVSKETLREIHSPHVVWPDPPAAAEFSDLCYGLGWAVQSYRGHRHIHHSGGFAGFNTKASFMPGESMGVVLLTNHGSNALEFVVPLNVYDRLLGLEQMPWNARAKRWARKAEAEAARENRRRPTKKAPLSHRLREYAGVYHHPGYGPVTIAAERGRLKLTYNDLTFVMRHRHYDVFGVRDFLASPVEVSFRTGSDGSIDSVVIPLEPEVAPIVFTRKQEGVE